MLDRFVGIFDQGTEKDLNDALAYYNGKAVLWSKDRPLVEDLLWNRWSEMEHAEAKMEEDDFS